MIAGVDEAGRGALAGPVVSASVILGSNVDRSILKDSKRLSKEQRAEISTLLFKSDTCIGIGVHSASFIDKYNILNATLSSMALSIKSLNKKPKNVLVDGNKTPKLNDSSIDIQAIVKGDQKVPEISAASIIAKVYRDTIMDCVDKKFPQYEFSYHKGYATESHYSFIFQYGLLTKFHRKSFNLTRQISLF